MQLCCEINTIFDAIYDWGLKYLLPVIFKKYCFYSVSDFRKMQVFHTWLSGNWLWIPTSKRSLWFFFLNRLLINFAWSTKLFPPSFLQIQVTYHLSIGKVLNSSSLYANSYTLQLHTHPPIKPTPVIDMGH